MRGPTLDLRPLNLQPECQRDRDNALTFAAIDVASGGNAEAVPDCREPTRERRESSTQTGIFFFADPGLLRLFVVLAPASRG
jgi:hypothetical protein